MVYNALKYYPIVFDGVLVFIFEPPLELSKFIVVVLVRIQSFFTHERQPLRIVVQFVINAGWVMVLKVGPNISRVKNQVNLTVKQFGSLYSLLWVIYVVKLFNRQ